MAARSWLIIGICRQPTSSDGRSDQEGVDDSCVRFRKRRHEGHRTDAGSVAKKHTGGGVLIQPPLSTATENASVPSILAGWSRGLFATLTVEARHTHCHQPPRMFPPPPELKTPGLDEGTADQPGAKTTTGLGQDGRYGSGQEIEGDG